MFQPCFRAECISLVGYFRGGDSLGRGKGGGGGGGGDGGAGKGDEGENGAG